MTPPPVAQSAVAGDTTAEADGLRPDDGLGELILQRRAEAEAARERVKQIGQALNDWGKRHYGSADAFNRAVADLVGCSVPHVGNVLRGHATSEPVLEVAEGLYLAARTPLDGYRAGDA